MVVCSGAKRFRSVFPFLRVFDRRLESALSGARDQRTYAMMNFGLIALTLLTSVALASSAFARDPKSHIEKKDKICRMEQQCHWVNFKKICTYVKVCR